MKRVLEMRLTPFQRSTAHPPVDPTALRNFRTGDKLALLLHLRMFFSTLPHGLLSNKEERKRKECVTNCP